MNDGAPYTREELEREPDGFPGRGPICPRCRTRIPQFAELSNPDKLRIEKLIAEGKKGIAMRELQLATGCSERFSKIWVLHLGKPHPAPATAPCPYCGEPLVTSQAKQCQHCYMNWHDSDRPYSMKTGNLNSSH